MGRSIRVVLADSRGTEILGMRVRDRNARVVSRSRNAYVGAMSDLGDDRTLFVPDDIVLERSLFDALPKLDPPLCLRAPDGAELVWGRKAAEAPVSELEEHHFIGVSDPTKRERAERILLRRTEKPTDGWVSRHINRPMSRFFSRWFLKAGLSANLASAISLALGVACGLAAAQPGGLWLALTGVLFQSASMFDGVDGEMARVTLQDSKLGAVLDSLADNLTYLATLVGFGIGWAREGVTDVEAWSLLIVLALVVLTLFVVLVFVRNHGPDMSFVFFDRSLRRAARDSNRTSLRVIDVFFRATRRDMLAVILMLASFLGSRFLIFCLVGLGVLVADYLLLFHWRDLVRAAGLLRAEQPAG
jgi:CDP-L-myo-inositol myo-inositolphosphotransferase